MTQQQYSPWQSLLLLTNTDCPFPFCYQNPGFQAAGIHLKKATFLSFSYS